MPALPRLRPSDFRSLLLFAGLVTVVTAPDFALEQLKLTILLLVTTLLTAQTSARWFDRRVGLLSGCVTATMGGLSIAVRGGDEVLWLMLCSVVVLRSAARTECQARLSGARQSRWTSLKEGVLPVAAASVSVVAGGTDVAACGLLVPMLAFALWSTGRRTPRELGQTLFRQRSLLVTTAGVLVTAFMLDPAALSGSGSWMSGVWSAVLTSRSQDVVLTTGFLAMLPWLPAVACGLWMMRHEAWGGGPTRERLLWCWSMAVPLSLLAFTQRTGFVIIAAPAWAICCGLALSRVSVQLFDVVSHAERQAARGTAARLSFATAAVFCCLTALINDPRPIGIGDEVSTDARAVPNRHEPDENIARPDENRVAAGGDEGTF